MSNAVPHIHYVVLPRGKCTNIRDIQGQVPPKVDSEMETGEQEVYPSTCEGQYLWEVKDKGLSRRKG